LQPLDRFVFVMSVLEGYADRECSALLGCTPAEVVEARIRALQAIRRSASSFREAGSKTQPKYSLSVVPRQN